MLARRLSRAALLALSILGGFAACDSGDDGSGGSPSTSSSNAASGTANTSSVAGSTTATTATGPGTTSSASSGTGGGAPIAFPPKWPDGTDCASEAPIFVWQLTDDTYVLRQSLCTSFEGPFLYLLFGDDKVLLEDTGDGGIPVQATVQGVIDDWLTAHGKASIELVVAHSHGHGDHVAGDGQFANKPDTTVVGTSAAAVKSFFGFTNWPNEILPYDLGGRVLDVIPIPGHQTAHIALYDRRHDLLLTGDTLYPGRLYISDFASYKASTKRMVDFVDAGNPVAFVLGTHVEMTKTPMQDFAFMAAAHPNEHALELQIGHLVELDTAVQAMTNPVIQPHADFSIYPL